MVTQRLRPSGGYPFEGALLTKQMQLYNPSNLEGANQRLTDSQDLVQSVKGPSSDFAFTSYVFSNSLLPVKKNRTKCYLSRER